MATGFILTCSTELVEGSCPAGYEVWTDPQVLDPFAMPSQADLSAAFHASIEVFFFATIIAAFAAWGVRMILDQLA